MKEKTKATTNNEFSRFEELTRKLVSVPKKEVDRREKEYKKGREKKRFA